jgi:spore germination protein YaaH
MFKNILLIIFGLLFGSLIAFVAVDYLPVQAFLYPVKKTPNQNKVIGFLPYWLAGKADPDYSKTITQLSYFGLTLDTDGTILTANEANEAEPGWNALMSGKLDDNFSRAKESKVALSLLVFSGDNESINQLISDPLVNAQNTLHDVVPIMKRYGFSDLNLDVESIQPATPGARAQFTTYVSEIKHGLKQANAGTLTVDISPDNIIRNGLIDLKAIAPFIDYVVIMGYDFHYPGSFVTGAVGPLYGAGISLEFDSQAAVELAEKIIPVKKIILGIPLYGYEWETIDQIPRSPVIPGTGLIASNARAETLLSSCATCSAGFDNESQEPHLIYFDPATGTYHQIFYPDKRATQAKVDYAKKANIGGLALWALGYEGETIMSPLENYLK